jgi:chorismate--pyruvate lyase
MNRWRRFPPPHRYAVRAWLVHPGSLTTRVIARHGPMRVEVLQTRMRIPNEDEYEALGRPTHKLAYVREVLLHAGGQRVVMAHSIVGRADLRGAWNRVRTLGTRPLATALFADPVVARGLFEFARLDSRHPLWKRASRLLGRPLPVLWARRSLFRRRGRPLMVTEVFLPGLVDPPPNPLPREGGRTRETVSR